MLQEEEEGDQGDFDDEDAKSEEDSFLESDEEEDKNNDPPADSRKVQNNEQEGEEENGDDEDDLSVQSSDSSSQYSMKETSRIGDSLDESIEAVEFSKQRHQQSLTSSSSKPVAITSIGVSYEVDSLGNMIPIQRKEKPNIPTSQPPSVVKNASLSSGSLLGSGGRNKTAPLQQGYV